VDRIIRACEKRRIKSCWPLAVVTVAAWPFWLNLVLFLVERPFAVTSPTSLALLAGLAALDALMLFAAWSAWTVCHRRSRLIDRTLKTQSDREVIARSILRRISHWRQAAPPCLAVAFGLLFLYFSSKQLKTGMGIDISFTSYVCVAWTSFLGGNVTYWLFTVPSLPRLLYLCPSLTLRWQDPASTPAIRLLADGFGVSALFLLAGTATVLAIAVWLPGFSDVTALRVLLDGFFLLFTILSFRVGLYTYAWMYAMVKREKQRALDAIERAMPPLSRLSEKKIREAATAWVPLYSSISSARDLPFSTAAVVQYTAALLGAVLTFVIQQIITASH